MPVTFQQEINLGTDFAVFEPKENEPFYDWLKRIREYLGRLPGNRGELTNDACAARAAAAGHVVATNTFQHYGNPKKKTIPPQPRRETLETIAYALGMERVKHLVFRAGGLWYELPPLPDYLIDPETDQIIAQLSGADRLALRNLAHTLYQNAQANTSE